MAKLSADKIIVIFTVISAALMQLIDTSIVNVSITQMMSNLGASFEEIGWVITGYAVSNVIMITLSGWMSTKFGRKYYFAGSIILFTIASVLCGLSTNVWELVVFRIIQGIGGGGLLSTAQAIIIETFPKEELGFANAIFGIGVIVGPAIGPTLGGYITDNLSWQWIFFINLPFGILATILTFAYVKESSFRQTPSKMDWVALAMLVAAIGSLQIVLEKGQEEDWFESKFILTLAIVAVGTGIVFVLRELKKTNPIVNLRLFNNRSFTTGTLFNFILGFGLYGTTLVVPVFCQSLLGFTAMQTGLIMLPGSLATGLMMPIVGSLMKRKFFHPAVYAGMGLLLFFVFSFMMSLLNTQISSYEFFWPLIIRGIAMGLIFIPLTTISLANLEGAEMPQGTAISNMIRQLGGSIGIALITTYISTNTAKHYADLIQNVNSANPATNERIGMMTGAFSKGGADIGTATSRAYALIARSANAQATFLTYKDIFINLGLFFLILIPLLIMFKDKKKKALKNKEEEEVEWIME